MLSFDDYRPYKVPSLALDEALRPWRARHIGRTKLLKQHQHQWLTLAINSGSNGAYYALGACWWLWSSMRTPGNHGSVVLRTFLDEGCHVFCLLSTGVMHPKRRSPNLEWRCSICSTVPRLTDYPLLMVVTLLRLLPWSALGIQCQYPSRTPWYSASRCVFDLACWLRVWLQWVLSTWTATTNWWAICLRAQGLVGRRTHTSDLAADCQQPLSLPNTMVADRLYGGARVTPGFFCCHQVYSEVERDLSQCIGSSTRTPHWQFLLENRDENRDIPRWCAQGRTNFGNTQELAWGNTCHMWAATTG